MQKHKLQKPNKVIKSILNDQSIRLKIKIYFQSQMYCHKAQNLSSNRLTLIRFTFGPKIVFMYLTIAQSSLSSIQVFSQSISLPHEQMRFYSMTCFSTMHEILHCQDLAGIVTCCPEYWHMIDTSISQTTIPNSYSQGLTLIHLTRREAIDLYSSSSFIWLQEAGFCLIILQLVVLSGFNHYQVYKTQFLMNLCLCPQQIIFDLCLLQAVRYPNWSIVIQFKFEWPIIITLMSKEAVLMIIDVGNSMDQSFSATSSRAKMALECCKLTLQQKIFNNSTHELGLVLFGENDSDDGNSMLLQQISKPKVEFVRKIQQLSYASFDNTAAGGDIFSSINYSLRVINDHCGKKKFNKRMFLFTNGMGQSDFDNKDLSTLKNKLVNSAVKLNIIPIDFMVSYNPSNNQLEGEMMLEPVQQRNAQKLMKLKQLCSDNIQIFPASLAIQLYKKFRKRDTNPVAKYRGVMEIAPGLQIDVATYKAVKRQKLQSLARYDTSIPFEPALSKEKEIINQTNFVVQGDESGKIVERDNIINAFNYGPQLVPISTILQTGSKIHEEKNLKFLGFVDKANIPRHCLLGQVDIVVPAEDLVGRKLFTAFIYSMLSLNKYAIARYVARNSKNGVIPRMVVLIPNRTAERQMFYLIELPTVEDVRDYPFNSLKKSTDRQQEIVKGLIDKMMLYHSDGEEIEQDLKVENTFNPTRQYFYQTIFYRALNTQSQDIPPLDPVIKNYMSPQIKKFEQTKSNMKDIKKEFKFTKKINLEAKKYNNKTLMWKDIIQQVSQETEKGKMNEQTEQAEMFVKPALKFSVEDEEQEAKFNPSNPISSFKKMINFNKKDLVHQALKYMNNYILQKLIYSITTESFKQIGECASEMRNACISQQEQNYWDDWFNEMSEKNAAFYLYLRSQGLGLIKGDNVEIFRPSSLHQEIIEEVCDLD